MADKLQWQEPLAVARWEYEHEAAPLLRPFFWLCVKWSLIVGLPTLYAMWRWLPEGFYKMLYGVLVCALLLPAACIFQLWVGSKWRARCYLSKRGVARITLGGNRAWGWKQIEAYRFEDDPRVVGARRLALKIWWGKRQIVRHLGYSPGEVDEREVAGILNQYLSPRPWDSV